jgi:hypothetical protein
MIAVFAVAMLRVTTLKIRKLFSTRTFLQLYTLLFMAQKYLYLCQQEILEDASTNRSASGGDDEEFQCNTESHKVHNCSLSLN